MKPKDRIVILLAISLLTIGAVMGVACAFAVGVTHPILGWLMASITLTPLLGALVFWLFVLEREEKKRK